MSRSRLLWYLFGFGAPGCVFGALIIYGFNTVLADANAVSDAPICPTPTENAVSSCLSVLTGRITWEGAVAKGNHRVSIALEDTTADVGYRCDLSPANACAFPIQAGTTVVTGWWKGHLVTFGAPGARPTVVTDANPVDQLVGWIIGLVFVIPGVSAVLAGFLLWQAPTTVDALVNAVLAQYPDPPRKVDRRLLWRATLGYSTWGGYIAWAVFYIVAALALYFNNAYNLTLFFFGATFVIFVGLAYLLAPVGLLDILTTSIRQTILVKRFVTGRNSTTVWYDLPDGTSTKSELGMKWGGRVKQGDRLDALTDSKGSILRMLSSPPAQA